MDKTAVYANAPAPGVRVIPSSSGAARALDFIWKDLHLTGKEYCVPTRTGSNRPVKEY